MTRVLNHRGDWHVAAWDQRRGELRDFALHCIRRVVLRRHSFLAMAGTIDSGAEVASAGDGRRATRRWMCALFPRPLPEEIKRWVMQFGSQAEVLEPASLRRQVAADAGAMAKSYGSPSVSRKEDSRSR